MIWVGHDRLYLVASALRCPAAIALTFAVLFVTACGDTTASGGTKEAPVALAKSGVKVRPVVRSAPYAVGLTFDRSKHLIYAEKDSGRIIRVVKGKKHTLARLSVSGGGEAGLLGLAIDAAGFVYASYTGSQSSCPNPLKSTADGGVQGHCIWRLKPNPSGSRLAADGLVFSASHPNDASNHVGGGIHIGPDGALYYTIGDLGENDDPDKGPGRSQNLSVPYGKMLRLDRMGTNTAAAGNPGSCGNVANDSQRTADDTRIFACGLRNTYEFAFGADGRLWGSEAGDGCDEINLIKSGVNYGWEPPRTDCAGVGAGKPFDTITGTPAGIDVWEHAGAGSWRGDVFYCLNSDGGKLVRMDPQSKKVRTIAAATGKCYLDLTARGGALYFSDVDTIYKLTR